VFKLWRDQRKLQLILSDQLNREYLDVLARLNVAPSKIARLAERLKRRESVTHVNLGARPSASRDPKDNFVLATAVAGKAKFIVTNDRDLLDIPESQRKQFKFEIARPRDLLKRIKE
jgi:putative PIN family toxin of toxin-antitoxin system